MKYFGLKKITFNLQRYCNVLWIVWLNEKDSYWLQVTLIFNPHMKHCGPWYDSTHTIFQPLVIGVNGVVAMANNLIVIGTLNQYITLMESWTFLLYWSVHKYIANPQHGPLSPYNLLKGPLICKIGFLFLMVQPRMVYISWSRLLVCA
jgi:hypothetical protein